MDFEKVIRSLEEQLERAVVNGAMPHVLHALASALHDVVIVRAHSPQRVDTFEQVEIPTEEPAHKPRKVTLNGKAVREARESQGLTQTVLGDKAGLSNNTISLAELGKGISKTSAIAIATGLGLALEDILP